MDNTNKLDNTALLTGLLRHDPEVLQIIFSGFLPIVADDFEKSGATYQDARAFFKAALVEIRQMQADGKLDQTVPVGEQIRTLALAHYADWMKERSPEAPLPTLPETPPSRLPNDLRGTRRKIHLWRQLNRLSKEETMLLLADADKDWNPEQMASLIRKDPDDLPGLLDTARQKLSIQLELAPDTDTAAWPTWAAEGLKDADGFALWQAMEVVEKKEEEKNVIGAPASKANAWMRYIAMALLLMVAAYALYNYITAPRMPKNMFNNHFDAPESIWADHEWRYADLDDRDSLHAFPPACEQLLLAADGYYQAGKLESAQEPLLLITLDTLTDCHADAWYYLGIIRLRLDDPGTALDCFSKIDDLELFGEEIYWYQSLCFVKLAENNPRLKEKAERAVQRFISQTRDSERRALAEQMLEKLR